MTRSPETRRMPRWLFAAGMCGVLLAQMALPALHAWQTSSSAPASWRPAIGSVPVTRAAQPGATHDPTTCPVCKSLLRSNPLMTSPAPRGEVMVQLAPAPTFAPACAWDPVAPIGPPSRAPPLRSLHLA